MTNEEINDLARKNYDLLIEINDLNKLIKEAFVLNDDDTIDFTGKLSEDSLELIRSKLE